MYMHICIHMYMHICITTTQTIMLMIIVILLIMLDSSTSSTRTDQSSIAQTIKDRHLPHFVWHMGMVWTCDMGIQYGRVACSRRTMTTTTTTTSTTATTTV